MLEPAKDGFVSKTYNFIDCYGPFQANQNDASIFEYILENDCELLSILEPKKTVLFLDRGNYLQGVS
jgi:hypothetical protein